MDRLSESWNEVKKYVDLNQVRELISLFNLLVDEEITFNDEFQMKNIFGWRNTGEVARFADFNVSRSERHHRLKYLNLKALHTGNCNLKFKEDLDEEILMDLKLWDNIDIEKVQLLITPVPIPKELFYRMPDLEVFRYLRVYAKKEFGRTNQPDPNPIMRVPKDIFVQNKNLRVIGGNIPKKERDKLKNYFKDHKKNPDEWIGGSGDGGLRRVMK